MIEQLRLLVKLQAVDKVLHDLEQEQQQIPARLGELAQAEDTLKAQLAGVQAELETVAARRKELEQEAENIRARQRRAENRLMGAKSQREYRAANAEIDEAKDAVKSLDDVLVGVMEQQEALEAQVAELGERLEGVSAQAEADRKELGDRLSAVNAEAKRLSGKRGGLCDGVDEKLMGQYDFIRSKRQGVALAPVTEGTCGACHMQLPPQQFNELQRMDKIMICPTCSRLIYWADAEPFADL